jgi:pimeloyl-ACP methyl ester carboxylesterase
MPQSADLEKQVHIPSGFVSLGATLEVPHDARSIVIFAHGSGSSRFSPRNNFVAEVLRSHGIGVLLMDLLTATEDDSANKRFDIDLLTRRLASAREWLKTQKGLSDLNVGLFGASTGSAAALKLAALLGKDIGAVVSRGGRPDLAGEDLPKVVSPTLLIVGGNDPAVLELNETAFEKLPSEKKLEIVPGATHLFEESGTLERVAYLAKAWFAKYL